jgi:hypothetical protein
VFGVFEYACCARWPWSCTVLFSWGVFLRF